MPQIQFVQLLPGSKTIGFNSVAPTKANWFLVQWTKQQAASNTPAPTTSSHLIRVAYCLVCLGEAWDGMVCDNISNYLNTGGKEGREEAGHNARSGWRVREQIQHLRTNDSD